MSDCSHRLTEFSWVAGRHHGVIYSACEMWVGWVVTDKWDEIYVEEYMDQGQRRGDGYIVKSTQRRQGVCEKQVDITLFKWMSPWIIHEEHSGYFWDNLTRNMYIQYTMNYDISWVVDIFAILWIATVKTLKHNHHNNNNNNNKNIYFELKNEDNWIQMDLQVNRFVVLLPYHRT